MQTALVLGRDPPRVCRDIGLRKAGALALMLTNLVVAPLATVPVTIWMVINLAAHGIPSPRGAIEVFQATLWVSVPALGVGSLYWTAYRGIVARHIPVDSLTLLALGPYQIAICLAAWGGLYDLITSPYHWHKTNHGPAKPPTDSARNAGSRSLKSSKWTFRMPTFGTRTRQSFKDA